MPGNILKVNVAVGQTVKEGEVLIVLEAMKMENEIYAPKAGTVAQVLVVLEAMKMENEIMAPKNGAVTQVVVSKGSTVDTGAPLVVIG